MPKDRITGLIIRDDALEWTTLNRIRNRLEVFRSGRLALGEAADVAASRPERVCLGASDAAGGLGADLSDEVPSTQGLGTKAEALAKAADLKKGVTVGLSSAQLLLRVVDLPLVSDDELSSMVQLQVDKISPFPVESMVISHEVLEKRENTGRVLIAAVREDIVDLLGKTLKAAGIFPARIDAVVLGWWRLLRDAGEIRTEGRQVLLLIDGPASEIMAFENGIPILFRSLGTSEGFAEDEFVGEMAREVSYTLISLELEHGGGRPCSVSVWHRGEAPSMLVEKLHDECLCEVSTRSLESLPFVSEGLARRTAAMDGAKLDLTPTVWRTIEKEKLFKKRMFVTGGVIFGIWALGAVCFLSGFNYQERKLASLNEEQMKGQKPAKEVREMRRRIFMIRRYTDKTHSALECLREISMLQPASIDLTSFSYRKGEAVKISAEAESVDLVYDFKNKLDGSTFFLETSLQGPRRDNSKRKEVFDIEMKLPGGEQ